MIIHRNVRFLVGFLFAEQFFILLLLFNLATITWAFSLENIFYRVKRYCGIESRIIWLFCTVWTEAFVPLRYSRIHTTCLCRPLCVQSGYFEVQTNILKDSYRIYVCTNDLAINMWQMCTWALFFMSDPGTQDDHRCFVRLATVVQDRDISIARPQRHSCRICTLPMR